MMNKGDFKKCLVVFTEGARVNFNMHGFCVPVFAGVLDGEPRTFGVVFEDQASKEAFAKQITDWIAQGRLTEFIMVMEAWNAIILPHELEKVQQFIAERGNRVYSQHRAWYNPGTFGTVGENRPAGEIQPGGLLGLLSGDVSQS
jgi:zona occludens toxin (predicted ATPase)